MYGEGLLKIFNQILQKKQTHGHRKHTLDGRRRLLKRIARRI